LAVRRQVGDIPQRCNAVRVIALNSPLDLVLHALQYDLSPLCIWQAFIDTGQDHEQDRVCVRVKEQLLCNRAIGLSAIFALVMVFLNRLLVA